MIKHNRASIYFLTLASSVILVSLVLGISFSIMRSRRVSLTDTGIDQARIHAQLGIQHALHFTHEAPNWRALLTNGVWLNNISIGQAVYTVTGIDPVDGILTNDPENPVELTAVATIHGISRTMRVRTQQMGLTILRYALAGGSDITIDGAVIITGDVTSNGNIDLVSADTWINGDARAVGTITSLGNITGQVNPNRRALPMPNTLDILAYYLPRATEIPRRRTIEKVLISPTSNPYGTQTNPDGLYLMNCNNRNITIQDCRIVGTLILVNPGSSSRIRDAVNWQPARQDFPALIATGNMEIRNIGTLQETQVGVDLNLPTEPGFGVIGQTFDNLINGAIYIDGTLDIQINTQINGPVIATGTLTLQDTVVINADETLQTNPPKAFRETHLSPIGSTWSEVIP
ncbi:MAG: hypothetical protein IID32_09175 [Planctomycetes bacterium]|nr:hypothetical protein [Planctomycetota bacterium]